MQKSERYKNTKLANNLADIREREKERERERERGKDGELINI